ncbi:unnamed protein product [Rangifer tarandus platyrhynchus]|uniref:Uncharacterized protein n=2 Tax=Rangifer tarandus platyrhynchus TaxID=3082113 RepID=A0ABN8Y399_RANTA|nr:unnamed protein product [Rangifer tarandus platyrhynchus]
MAAGADAPAGPGLGLERSPFRPPSGRGERACAVRCAAGCRSHSEDWMHTLYLQEVTTSQEGAKIPSA